MIKPFWLKTLNKVDEKNKKNKLILNSLSIGNIIEG